MEVLVVGGAGAMGSWFVDFFREHGHTVSVSDIDADDSVPLDECDGFDCVVVAVPIDVTVDVVEEVVERMTSGLLMDVTSVKGEPVEAMQEAADDVEVLGTHPMFGPTVRSMRGQTVIVVEERPGPLTEEVVETFEEAGANVQHASPLEHDEMMAVVQGLTHYSYVSIGRALERLEFDVGESRRFMSPVYSIMLDFVGRVLDQNPHLYADIQMHQPVEEVHEALIESAASLAEDVADEDHEGFVSQMQAAARHYGDTTSAHRRSGKLIDASVSEYHELHESVGEERAVRHIYSDVVHLGVVEDVEGQMIHLNKDGELTKLKTENVELLSREDARRWKEENLPRVERDVSVVFAGDVDVDVLENVAVDRHDDVLDAEVFDVYTGEAVADGATSYGVRLTLLDDGEVEEAVESVEEVLDGLGGSIRR